MLNTHQQNIYVLVANASKAHIYTTSRLGQKMELITSCDHPESRQKAVDLTTDRSGSFRSEKGGKISGHGSFVDETSPKEVEIENFAHELAQNLERARTENQYDKLVIIAPPHFHGLLNKFCDAKVLKHVIHHIEKDYTKLSPKELQAHLEALS